MCVKLSVKITTTKLFIQNWNQIKHLEHFSWSTHTTTCSKSLPLPPGKISGLNPNWPTQTSIYTSIPHLIHTKNTLNSYIKINQIKSSEPSSTHTSPINQFQSNPEQTQTTTSRSHTYLDSHITHIWHM